MRRLKWNLKERPLRLSTYYLSLLVVLCSILCSLAFSVFSVSAVSMSTLLNPTGEGLNTCTLGYVVNDTGVWNNVNANQSFLTAVTLINQVRCNTEYDYKKDKVYEFKVLLKARSFDSPIYYIWTVLPPDDDWRLLSYEELFYDKGPNQIAGHIQSQQVIDDNNSVVVTTTYADGTTSTSRYTDYESYISKYLVDVQELTGMYNKVYTFYLSPKRDFDDYKLTIGRSTGSPTLFRTNNVGGSDSRIELQVGTIYEYEYLNISSDMEEALESQSEKEKEEIQDQADESEDTANEEAEASEQQGQSLLSILTTFFNSLSSPSGNCNIDLDLTGYNAGHNNVNLCALSPPSGVTTLLSVVVVGFVIMAVIHTVEAMIQLYREFQS